MLTSSRKPELDHPPLWWVASSGIASLFALVAYALVFGVLKLVERALALPTWPMLFFAAVFVMALGVIATIAKMADEPPAETAYRRLDRRRTDRRTIGAK